MDLGESGGMPPLTEMSAKLPASVAITLPVILIHIMLIA